jgi:hypothetical protein
LKEGWAAGSNNPPLLLLLRRLFPCDLLPLRQRLLALLWLPCLPARRLFLLLLLCLEAFLESRSCFLLSPLLALLALLLLLLLPVSLLLWLSL